MKTLIKTVNLNKVYTVKTNTGLKSFSAIKDINLEIYKGETFGVIGESGSGKTTLGKTIIRLVEPTNGKIFYKNIDISALNERSLRRLRSSFQVVFQDPYKSLNPRLSIGNAISEGMPTSLNVKEKFEKTRELLEVVGIDSKKFDNFPHQFSGGERQRIAIARALSTNPEFLICDEPTSNLDLSIQAKILNLLIDLKEKLNLTYLFISHNLQIIRFLSDRISVMYKGEIIEEGKTSDIISAPQHPYTKTLLQRM
ncbi:ATP-binding cassette domain-containing protein [bacterium]|nr:ATP-binding cassette domain-containing protein [bacterium]